MIEVTKIIGKMWKDLDKNKKEKYSEAFRAEMDLKNEKKRIKPKIKYHTVH